MGESIERSECQGSMQRMHEKIDEVIDRVDATEKCAARVEQSASNIEKSVAKMEDIMYGSKDSAGIATKVSNLDQKVGGVYWFGGVIIVAFTSALAVVIIGLVLKK